jgi:hypothetical protein
MYQCIYGSHTTHHYLKSMLLIRSRPPKLPLRLGNVLILQGGRVTGVMDVSGFQKLMNQDVLNTEISVLGSWARPRIAVIAEVGFAL